QRAAVSAEGGARAAQDDDVFHAFIVPLDERTARTMAFSTASAAARWIATVSAVTAPAAMQKTVSPSRSVCAGRIARASPSWPTIATRRAASRPSFAPVTMHPLLVF